MVSCELPSFNGGMRKPVPEVLVRLGPSRIACAMVALLASTALVVLVATPLPLPALLASMCLVVVWAAERTWTVGLGRGRRAVRAVHLNGNDRVTVHFRDGRSAAGTLCASSRVAPRFATIVWREKRWLRRRSLLILPDMLSPDAFRELRVLMRYG
jgi:hypothetical protein